MKYPLMFAAAVAGVLAVPAYAQDLSGFRVEARGGWERVGADASIPNPDDDEDVDGDEFLNGSANDSGLTYGVEAGYDAQIGKSLVLGAYLGADFSDADICGELIEDDLACTGQGRTFTAGVRAGVPIRETALIYVKGGYSNGKLTGSYDFDVTDNDDTTPGPIAEFDSTMDGFHVGGGFELGVTENAYIKLEYVYTDYGNKSWLLGDDADEDPTLKVGSDRHQVLFGVGMRF